MGSEGSDVDRGVSLGNAVGRYRDSAASCIAQAYDPNLRGRRRPELPAIPSGYGLVDVVPGVVAVT